MIYCAVGYMRELLLLLASFELEVDYSTYKHLKMTTHTLVTYLRTTAILKIESRFFLRLHQLLYLDIPLINLLFILCNHLF